MIDQIARNEYDFLHKVFFFDKISAFIVDKCGVNSTFRGKKKTYFDISELLANIKSRAKFLFYCEFNMQ